ncbi:hypothetical protein A1QO_00630 [Vibrio genomosp. F10 str. ZF-129]|uniref:Integrating conjugative element protein n=1 Tax=Vibrio genomosp. F10 str. ZF-129 TaxID=1187848 RepID=A0A1E5BGB2_9VIBR|nr:TraU family protein [Vibrio genomosp. F10]OEE35297.1 hypothetical protein A1QO_00630 [Vibrio genomosp. F10 str. ZF-129]
MKKIISILLTICLISPLQASEDAQSTMPFMELSTASMAPQCVKWKVTGMCFWMTCTPFGCFFSSSVKVNHWNPDLVVEVKSDTVMSPMGYTAITGEIFKEIGGELLNLAGIANDGLQSSSSGSANPNSSGGNASSSQKFYDATVIGNPALLQYSTFYGTAFGTIGWCQSPATPLNIYYDSLLDAFEWRVGMFEGFTAMYQSEPLGPPLVDTFGDLYPRIGTTINSSPYKSASTLAYRAAHIVTMGSGMHATLGTLPPTSTTSHSWPVLPMTNYTALWSNVKPFPSVMCQPMASELQHSIQEGSAHSELQNYLKILWRNYTCCYRRGSKLISG